MRVPWFHALVEFPLGLFASAVKAATCLVNGHTWLIPDKRERMDRATAAARRGDPNAALVEFFGPMTFECAKCGREEKR